MVSRIKHFAITGGIACGKSTVADWLPQMGGIVLDADAVVHDLEEAGGDAVQPILAVFGSSVMKANGAVDRARLGRRVFQDPDALAALNALVHPLVKRRIEQWLASPAPGNIRFRAVLIPLLFEVGWPHGEFDAVIAVVCDEAEQMRRLKGRGLSEADARLRIASQMPCAKKAQLADYAIWNNGNLEALRETAERLFATLLENES
jgi:dephospho-CoA kinase